ncbi:hypothetical protein A2803_01595 [Candidatus Woesebacteria bacterium RIFCSPHIGHO2_01_FULL_44_21]|uniref:Uncharacterized protein n=1 Tax=Candidatus Woesebacteria bacterium RIFCSPHIGHO2_01_FULL_44_21 TaxID=1802503 RepID=A0A1F7YVA6_9BACT|nr:MAG: hypothetical protein A2803_01595 [Candidatus Woesebacteria bacterium RIFCSPHIGHO2_01_FULL_44_21]OGM69567.1 MAG: hypothetical protein A2897_03110 [Candidatus Woesebacteria bacterium RIFCSPLOWO2_01_FULL_44_24b]
MTKGAKTSPKGDDWPQISMLSFLGEFFCDHGIRSEITMSRNFFDAGHNCPKTGYFVEFRIWIGNPIVCPKCGNALEVVPLRYEGEQTVERDQKVINLGKERK